jgi:type IV secretion system protein VirB4
MSAVPVAIDKYLRMIDALPYEGQIDPWTVLTREGDVTGTLEVRGLPFDAMPNRSLDAKNSVWATTLSELFRSTQLSLWTHIVRQSVTVNPIADDYDNHFSREFANQYARKYGNAPQFINRLYLSPVVRLHGSALDRAAARFSRSDKNAIAKRHLAATDALQGAMRSLASSLTPYQPTILECGASHSPSPTASFYARLINGEPINIVPARINLSRQLAVNHIHFAAETVAIHSVTRTRYAAILTLVVPYGAESTHPTMLQGLLAAPFEFVLSQSAVPYPFDTADKMLGEQINRIQSTSGSELILADLNEARSQLGAGRMAFVSHELLLTVYADTPDALKTALDETMNIFNTTAMPVQRAVKGIMQPAYWSMLPGNFQHGRLFAKPITTHNLAHLFPLHNYAVGDLNPSHWGAPVAVLKTPANSPFYFHFHLTRNRRVADTLIDESNAIDDDTDDERDDVEDPLDDVAAKSSQLPLGNYRVIGQSGGGKTAFVMAMRTLAHKRQVHPSKPLRTFSFDFGYGEQIGIQALGGEYFTFAAGAYTGLNPFALPDNEKSVQLIHAIATWCNNFEGKHSITPAEDVALYKAIQGVYQELKPEERRFARILDALPADGDMNLRASLQRWAGDGPLAWVLDSETDRFDFSQHNDFGFDTTHLLDIPEAKTPIVRLLLHKTMLYASGSPHIIHFAEAWQCLDDPMMQAVIRKLGKTIRKRNGIIGLDFQDIEDTASKEFASSIKRQFPTLVMVPDAEATADDYCGKFGLTLRELELVRSTMPNRGLYIVKQASQTSVVSLDLSGLDDMLAVLSSNDENVALVNQLRAQLGNEPEAWLPTYYQRRT